MYKHHCMLRPEIDRLRWLKGIAQFEMSAYEHVPFLYESAKAAHEATRTVSNAWNVERLAREGAVNRFKDLPIATDRKTRRIERSPRVWEQLQRIYGFGLTEFREFEGELEDWRAAGRRLPHILKSQALQDAVALDDL